MNKENIYSSEYVKALFDEMAQTYGLVNYITSFGFAERWRKQCVEKLDIESGAVVYDLMSGMGELWGLLLQRIGQQGKVLALDISEGMVQRSKEQSAYRQWGNIEVSQVNFFENQILDNSVDLIVSSFGVKTFSDEQLVEMVREYKRILKSGGHFSLIEISAPENLFFKIPYMFYIKYVIPLLGKLFLGNPDNYRMLGIYTEKFGSCIQLADIFKEHGFDVTFYESFYGCATGIVGKKAR